MGSFDLKKIQSILQKMNFDAWLFFDFRASNELALEILGINKESHLTRRFYYIVPKEGEPVKIVNGIEAHNLNHLPGKLLKYSSRTSLDMFLKQELSKFKNVAMEYSPLNAIPYVSRVDAGTIEYIKTFNVEIKSSADLISSFAALWTKRQYEDNKDSAIALYEIVEDSFKLIKDKIDSGITEYDVQSFIMSEFERRNLVTDFPAIVAVNENSANPHYGPTKDIFKPIKKEDFVLIDLWAKPNKPDGVFADITWTGYVASSIPEKYSKVFNIVAQARDAAFNLIKERFDKGLEVRGYEADQICRDVIENAGYGDFFIHRTGHSITGEIHGSGAHLDNFETKDERLLLPNTSFSIEPGIYLPGDFGVRSEIDVYIDENGKVMITGKEKQKEIVAIL